MSAPAGDGSIQIGAQYLNTAWRDQCVAEMEQRIMLQAALAQLQAENAQLREQIRKQDNDRGLYHAPVERAVAPDGSEMDHDPVNTAP